MSNEIKELVDRIRYYGTSYAIGDNPVSYTHLTLPTILLV